MKAWTIDEMRREAIEAAKNGKPKPLLLSRYVCWAEAEMARLTDELRRRQCNLRSRTRWS